MAAVYLFSESLQANTISAMHKLGPGYRVSQDASLKGEGQWNHISFGRCPVIIKGVLHDRVNVPINSEGCGHEGKGYLGNHFSLGRGMIVELHYASTKL